MPLYDVYIDATIKLKAYSDCEIRAEDVALEKLESVINVINVNNVTAEKIDNESIR